MWVRLVDAYLAVLGARGRRPVTLRGYRSDLVGMVSTWSDDVAVGPALTRWVASLDSLAPATRARKVSAARGFLRWATKQGVTAEDLEALDRPAAPVTAAPVVAPDPTVVGAVLAAIPLHADRDQLLFKLPARAGLRPGEVLGLRVDDFDEPSGVLRVDGRGGIERRVLVDDSEVALRLTHWTHATQTATGPMFRADGRTEALRYQSMQERWSRYTTTAGVRLRLTDLRLHHAAELLAGGVPEWAVRERLGQAHGPLPLPNGPTADDEIRAWRQRLTTPLPASPARAGARERPAG